MCKQALESFLFWRSFYNWRSINTQKKKNEAYILLAWPIKDLLCGFTVNNGVCVAGNLQAIAKLLRHSPQKLNYQLKMHS